MTTTISERLAAATNRYNQRVGQRDALARSRSEYEDELARAQQAVQDLGKVLAVFHSMAEATHAQFLRAIEELVSGGLTAIFGETIPFHIVPTIRGGRVELDFSLGDDKEAHTDLINARGGGLVSVIGTLLRIITVRLLNATQHQVVILDEPLSHLSAEFVPACAELLRKLADDLGIQIIMVTHQPEFAESADTVYEFRAGPEGTEILKV